MNRTAFSAREIEAQATAWLVRRDGGMDLAADSEFKSWCEADPRHRAALAAVESMWAAFDRPARAGRQELVRARLRALEKRDRRRHVAVGLGVAALFAVMWVVDRAPPAAAEKPAALAAAPTVSVSQPERRILPDGSVVESKAGTEFAVDFSPERRRIVLQRGEAHFSVTTNRARPFFVEAAGVTVRAVGTAFSVQLARAEVGVLVTEGRVSVSAGSPGAPVPAAAGHVAREAPDKTAATPLVEAGQRAVVPLGDNRPVPVVAPVPAQELGERLAWRQTRIDFSDATIAEAIAAFNRHAHQRLRIDDPAVAARRVTGVFRSDNVTGFLRAVEAGLGIQSEPAADGGIVLRAP